jgi:hypothetical protein
MTGQVASAVNATTGYTHTFSQMAGYPAFIPWMGFRRYVPGVDNTTDVGDIGIDCLISSVTFNFPQVGPLSVDMDVQGRDWALDDAPDLWTWADVYEDYDSVPMVMKGTGIRLPNLALLGGNPLPATNARVTLANNTTTVQEERVIGSYFPDDFATRQRVLTVELTYKWSDPNLYRFILNGGNPADTDFSPCVPNSDFEIEVESPCDVDPGTIDFPWKFKISAPNVSWQATPLQLSGDDILTFDVTGTALEASTGLAEDYFSLDLENEVASYPMPT